MPEPIEFSSATDLTPKISRPTAKAAINFTNGDESQDFQVGVFDKYPELGEVHIEGRRYVEVSIEMFIALMQQNGFLPVAPAGAEPDESIDDSFDETNEEGEDA